MRVERSLFGTANGAEFRVDEDARIGLEQGLRRIEVGLPGSVGDCGLGAFMPRYTASARYLVFARYSNSKLFGGTVYRIDGNDVVFTDGGLRAANNGYLFMERSTYDAWFAAYPFSANTGCCYILDGRVPVAVILRAIAGLRDDPSILPPDTGNAGLAARR